MPLSGNLWSIGRNVLGFLSKAEARFGPVVRARLGAVTYHLVSDPALAEQILWRQSDRYTRLSRANRMLRDITGSSLLTTEGPEWLARRKLIAPFFSRAHLLRQVPMMAALTERHLQRWGSYDVATGLDATAWLMQLTCSVATKVLFGAEVEDPALAQAMDGILTHHWRRLRDPLQLAHRLPTRSRKAFDAGNRVVGGIVGALGVSQGGETLLGAVQAAAGDATGIGVADELVTLLIAGHETTAAALCWAMYLLAVHPDEQERLRDEANAVAHDARDRVELPAAVRIFQEAMRLYPPIWLIERQTLHDTEVGGYQVAAGGSIVVSPWVMHRSERWWDHPSEFRPERFQQAPAKNTFIPFGLGPHACVGTNLALLEGPLVLSLFARRWRWRLQPRTLVAPQPGLTLRMQRPLRLQVEAA